MGELYREVPKGFLENLQYRENLLLLTARSEELQRQVWLMASRDILFWMNTCLWTWDPRGEKTVPWITWGFQDETILAMESHLLECMKKRRARDMAIKKSRDMGATWMMLAFDLHRWLFRSNESYLLVSRKAELVDKLGDPDCLFWKLDFMVRNLPTWMVPFYIRTEMRLENPGMHNTINGDTTNADIGRGGRRTGIGFDEFGADPNGRKVKSASNSTTYFRLFNSTPRGSATAFADICKNPKTNLVQLHWSQHPYKNQGMYKKANGRWWSPWAEEEYARINSDWEWMQEYELSDLGSSCQFFDDAKLDELEKRDAMPAWRQGVLEFDRQTLQPVGFEGKKDGQLRLWMNLNTYGQPPPDSYTVGVDVCAGRGQSNSILSVGSRTTGEKVAEYADPWIDAHDLGQLAVALCRWLGDAFLIWEANGPGLTLGKEVVRSGYRNIFRRYNEQDIARKPSDTPGWWATPENKAQMLRDYKQALGLRFINRSKESLDEAREYVYFPGTGIVGHCSQANTRDTDPSGARANHGDRVIADGLCFKAMKEIGLPDLAPPAIVAPRFALGSLGYFREQNELAKANAWT